MTESVSTKTVSPWRPFLLTGLAVLIAGACAMLWTEKKVVRAVISDTVGIYNVEQLAEPIRFAAEESGVDAELLAALVYMESRGKVDAKSSAGALGLMQLMPDAASDAATRLGIVDVPTEAQLLTDGPLNLRLGAGHLAWLLEHRGEWTLEQVLVAYNGGRQKLFRWIRRAGSYAEWVRLEEAREAAGEGATGALSYARKALQMRERFAERGTIRIPSLGE